MHDRDVPKLKVSLSNDAIAIGKYLGIAAIKKRMKLNRLRGRTIRMCYIIMKVTHVGPDKL